MSNEATPRPWLWPDHIIYKRESRRLREEHNRAVNAHDGLVAALKAAYEQMKWVPGCGKPGTVATAVDDMIADALRAARGEA